MKKDSVPAIQLGDLTMLFEPIKIGGIELPNRIVMPAISTNYDYDSNERFIRFYQERADGGVGLIILGAFQTIYPGRRSHIGKFNLHNASDVPVIKEWVKAIQIRKVKVGAQLATYGYWAKNGMVSTPEDVGPSELLQPMNELYPTYIQQEFPPRVRSLSIEEIMVIEQAIGEAAVRAQQAGFDAIELQIAAGNLLCRFINPFTNRRLDEYGGSLENRTRIVVRAIENIKSKLGKNFPLICRIPGSDLVPWDLGLDGWKQVAKVLEMAGAHALSVYPGWHESRVPRHQMCVPRGAFVPLAESIRRAVNIPVATNIRINDPILAEKILKEDKVDLIAMGTPLIADPFLPKKAREGRKEDIRMCTGCCNCWDDLSEGKPITCSVNPRAGMETKFLLSPAMKKMKVFVVGGGPAGMEAARAAACRGHSVTLFERERKLGGQLLYVIAGPYKEEWNSLIDYYEIQLKEASVEVKLNKNFTADTLLKEQADVVILATGAVPLIPELPGVSGNNVATAVEILSGKKESGKIAVVVGGGAVGCQTAEFLWKRGSSVTILEQEASIGRDIGGWNRWVVMDRLRPVIRVETNTKVEEVTGKGVYVTRAGRQPEFFEADTVVLAVGWQDSDSLRRMLEGRVPLVYRTGDHTKQGKIKDAIAWGFQVAMQI